MDKRKEKKKKTEGEMQMVNTYMKRWPASLVNRNLS